MFYPFSFWGNFRNLDRARNSHYFLKGLVLTLFKLVGGGKDCPHIGFSNRVTAIIKISISNFHTKNLCVMRNFFLKKLCRYPHHRGNYDVINRKCFYKNRKIWVQASHFLSFLLFQTDFQAEIAKTNGASFEDTGNTYLLVKFSGRYLEK